MPIPRCIHHLAIDRDSELARFFHLQEFFAFFQVGCPCGQTSVEILGYYTWSEAAPDERVFIGPIGIQCPRCNRESEVMDPEIHGYNGEIHSNTTMRGSGLRDHWECPQCGNRMMEVAVAFGYQIDVDEDMAERPEDFFDVFKVFAHCSECDHLADVTTFDCT